MKLMWVCAVLLVGALAARHCQGAPETGTRLHYLALSAKTDFSPPFASVDFVYGPAEKGGRWWHALEIRDAGASTNHEAASVLLCTVRGLTMEAPLGARREGLRFARYQLRVSETNEALEYVEAHSGKPLLPPWVDFQKNFIPRPASGTRWWKGAPQTCEFLGQILTLESVEAGDWKAWPDVKRLALDREVLIGTGRSFKDKEGHRLPQTPASQGSTLTSEFVADDYRVMMDAGMNLFTVRVRAGAMGAGRAGFL